MADLERQLREHYERQRLSDERARAILAAGRCAAEARRNPRRRWWLAAAAAVVIGLGVWSVMRWPLRETPAAAAQIAPQDAAEAVREFFARPDYQLAQVSGDPSALADWLREHGAPAALEIPPAMAALPSFGCHVLAVAEQRVYLICFFLDVTPEELAATGGMPVKKEMTVTAPDGSMMKKDRPLAHLVIAPRAAFRTAPAPGMRVQFSGEGDWNFETWSEGDVVYLVAAAAPPERIAELTRGL